MFWDKSRSSSSLSGTTPLLSPRKENSNGTANENDDNKKQATITNAATTIKGNRKISMRFVKCLSGIYCQDCGTDPLDASGEHSTLINPSSSATADSGLANLQTLQHSASSSSSISPLVLAPMRMKDPSIAAAAAAPSLSDICDTKDSNSTLISVESIMGEYMALCQFYKIPYNAGVLSTLRFSLPCLRVTGSFHDLDMLAVTELLLHHSNTTLRYISRLDFSIASKEGRQFKSYKLGFTSHGALALAKVLQTTKYIKQVWLPRHRIGPYGASAIFLACQENPTIQTLNMRRCRIGERGAFAFVEALSATKIRGLIDVDLSSNGIGHRGTVALQRLQEQQNETNTNIQQLFVNLEGNLVFPEIMNAITHCLGVILSIIGSYMLSDRVKGLSPVHTVSCAIYSTSLLSLYISSTLYHSFFPLQNTKYIFQVFDKCAIYVLIAGSYTPFLQILLGDQPIWSIGLLGFIWFCGLTGIAVEAFCPTWQYRPWFSLAMYLGMGWAALACLPALKDRLTKGCINLVILGGVGYTSGVPFFVRNNNLDHAIWHLFVLSGSILHWLAVYIYVAPFTLEEFQNDRM